MSLFSELKRRNVLRVGVAYTAVSWLLIQIAGTIFPVFGLGDDPTRILIILLLIGFLPTLIFTWLFQLTPGGLRKEADWDAAQTVDPRARKQLNRVIILVMSLALAYFAVDKFLLEPQREVAAEQQAALLLQQARLEARNQALTESYGEKSLAVLAFEDMSQGGDQAYLADGIAEEILNLLARVPGLRVISRSSSFSYKGEPVPLARIARELDVAHVLEGSVRLVGNRVRITAQLIDARTDTHLWSQSYDRTLDDIFAIQDEIAAAVVAQLKITLLAKMPRVDSGGHQAYAMVLQARYLARQGTASGYAESIALYQQALALQPTYLAAWIGLATNYSNQANKSLRPAAQGYALARAAALQALAIDPDYAPALAHLGWIAMVYDADLEQAARYLERALALAPTNLAIIGNAASLLYALGRNTDSIVLDEYVVRHDPVNPTGYSNLAEGYLAAGRWDAAIAAYRSALRLSPGRIAAEYFIGVALLCQGEPAAALAAFEKESFEVLRLLGLVMAHHALGSKARSDAILAGLIDKYQRDAAYNIAYALAYRGEPDRAFDWLGRAVANDDPGLADIVGEPLFSCIHDDPRWRIFLESIGKGPQQLGSIRFNVSTAAAPVALAPDVADAFSGAALVRCSRG